MPILNQYLQCYYTNLWAQNLKTEAPFFFHFDPMVLAHFAACHLAFENQSL